MSAVTHRSIQLALRGKLFTLPTLPKDATGAEQFAADNVEYVPVQGQPYIEESYVPATTTLRGLVFGGMVEATGLYVLKWYGVANTGLGDLVDGVDALLSLFPPGSSIPLPTGEVVRIRGDVAPYRGQLQQAAPGFAVILATVPYRVLYNNSTTN